MFSQSLRSPTEREISINVFLLRKDVKFDVKFVWLFRYGFLCRAVCLKARYCELTLCVIWDLGFSSGMSAKYVFMCIG